MSSRYTSNSQQKFPFIKSNSPSPDYTSKIRYSSNPQTSNSVYSNYETQFINSNTDTYSDGVNVILNESTVLEVMYIVYIW